MIPRQTLKKIRPIELRTNRIVTETLAGFSFQPPAQFRRIPSAVENRHDRENVIFDREINAVSLESFLTNHAPSTAHLAKQFGLCLRAVQRLNDFLGKFFSQTRRFIFIPNNGLKKFGLRVRLEKGIKIHHQPKRCRITALTCSNGIPSRGFFSNSARRRSSSAVCSGVRSGSNPSSTRSSLIFRASSIRSSSGRVLAASNNSVALMAAIYSFQFVTQARFFARANSAFSIQHSSFPPT